MSPAPCAHDEVRVAVHIERRVDAAGRTLGRLAALRLWCEACGQPFLWQPEEGVRFREGRQVMGVPVRPATRLVVPGLGGHS